MPSTLGLTIAVAAAITAAQAAQPGDRYMVSSRCVTITSIQNTQARYEWSSGNARGSGTIPVSQLTARCSASAPSAPAPTNQLALTAAEAKAMVDAHNRVRAEVGVGPVAWDQTVAAYAQRYVETLAKSCRLAHSAGGGYGENLAAWTGSQSPVQAVAQWAGEKPKYRGGGGPLQNADMAAGHYTQVVWRDSVRIGCGRVTCSKPGESWTWTFVSCNYSPGGNTPGERVY